MDYLWSPWRFQYVSTPSQPGQECIFCYAFSQNRDRELLVARRAQHCAVILNRFPYTPGHVMIAPYRHLAFLEDASPPELHDLVTLAALCQKALRLAYRPEGLNLGMNLGRCAGAGVADHFHLHVLPRWTGDSNFLTVVGETRTLPEELHTTYDKIRQFLDADSN